MSDRDEKLAHMEANYSVFEQHLERLLKEHPGSYALIGNEDAPQVFARLDEALSQGCVAYPSGDFIVQEIVPQVPIATAFHVAA